MIETVNLAVCVRDNYILNEAFQHTDSYYSKEIIVEIIHFALDAEFYCPPSSATNEPNYSEKGGTLWNHLLSR